MTRPIVIAAGGTGGHFFPAEALAATLIARGHRIVLMTDARSGALHSTVFAKREIHVLRGAGIAGRGAARAVRAGLALTAGTLAARRILAGLDAAAIVGFGGYPSVPPVLASRMLARRPMVVLQEQNAVLGRANRFLSRFADLLALGASATRGVPAGVARQVTGNPVRPAIAALAGEPYAARDGDLHLLVTGGSLGARVFSDVVPQAVALLPEALRARLRIVQQCRAEDIDGVRAAYAALAVPAELANFFTDIGAHLQAADVVIARAGAGTCAELAVIGRAAILVPLPGAIDDHQTANAEALKGAVILSQSNLTASRLAGHLADLLGNPGARARAAGQIAACARTDAAGALADAVERLIAVPRLAASLAQVAA